MFRAVLHWLSRWMSLGIAVGFLGVSIGVFFWQNYTTVSREGDFSLATERDLVMAHRWDDHDEGEAGQSEPMTDNGGLRSDTRVVAKKFVLRKRAGLGLGNRGHSVFFEATFPEFPATSTFLRDVNRRVGTSHVDAASEFAMADWSLVRDELWDRTGWANREWSGQVMTDVVHVSERAVSLLELHGQYTGGAHGNSCFVARCFIEENGQARELLTLAELFEPSSNWSQRLIEYCSAELRRQGASSLTYPEEMTDESELTPPQLKADDLATFVLASSGLWFFFAPYHVGCYAEGSYSVKVPYAVVQDCIPQGSPARLFLRPQGE